MEKRFLTNNDLIKNEVKGKYLIPTDSTDDRLSNLVIYGRSTQLAEPTPEAPQDIISVGAEPFDVYAINDHFYPLYITAVNTQYYENKKPTYSPSTKNDQGVRINSLEYNNEIIAIQEGTNIKDEPISNLDNGAFNIYFDPDSPHYEFGKIYTFIADYEVLENKHSSGNMGIIIATFKNNMVTLQEKGKICVKITCDQNTTHLYRKSIAISLKGKSIHFKNIMWLEGDWTKNPPTPMTVKAVSGTYQLKGYHAIPVESGGNYTDENGQNWVADTLDCSSGKLYKRIAVERLPFTVTWHLSNSYEEDGWNVFYCHITNWECTHSEVLCTHYPFNGINPTSKTGVWVEEDADIGMKVFVKVPAGKFDMSSFTTYVRTNQILMLYCAKEVNIGSLTSGLDIYQTLKTSYPTTRIFNGENAYMGVEYTCDTQNYVNNKFAELTALVLEG
jgi:hypothetical protein